MYLSVSRGLLWAAWLAGSVLAQYAYRTEFVTLRVDHFNFNNNDTFSLRYLVNDSFWLPQEGAPIFFYTGNEGDVTMFAQNTGLMWDFAPEFNALLVFAEHRYYGLSMPYGNKSFDSLSHSGYLSSSQALADFADVITHVKDTYKVDKNRNPVIVFGGSYGGMLAAWFRMKYPSHAIGALASSAPIWQFEDLTPCDAFYSVVSSVYKNTSKNCFKRIQLSWSTIDKEASTDEGKERLRTKLKLCSPLKSREDVTALKDWFSSIWVNLAMLNYPYETNFMTKLPANPVKTACSKFSSNNSDIIQDIFNGASVFFNTSGEANCLDISNANGKLPDTWDFQTCTEMVMPMCVNGDSMFPAADWDFVEYSKQCWNKYKTKPQEYLVEQLYGGRNIKAASNIIFSNGLLDPWSSGGVLFSPSKTLRVVVIPDSAHHLDLRAANPLDPESITQARNYYRYTFKHWIKKQYIHYKNSA